MKERKSTLPDLNMIGVDTPVFVQYYNKNVPEAFPRASLHTLIKFQETHPGLFEKNNEWTIDKHRKKLMDWLASYKENN